MPTGLGRSPVEVQRCPLNLGVPTGLKRSTGLGRSPGEVQRCPLDSRGSPVEVQQFPLKTGDGC